MNPLGQIGAPSLVRTITIRLVLATIFLMMLQAGIVAVRDYINETDFLNNYVRREALKVARALPVQKGAPLKLPSQYVGANSGAYAFRIIENDGRILLEHNGFFLVNYSPWNERPSARQDYWVRDVDTSQRMYVVGGIKTKRENRDVWVELASFGDPDDTYLGNIAQDILDDVWVPMLPLVLLTILVAAISVESSLRPLTRAAQRADEIAVLEKREHLAVAELPAEAYHFASAVNRLLDRVADLVAAQRQFIARAAHELRTPLSIMMLEISNLKEENAKRLEADVRQMSEIVDQLLALSRLEAIGTPEMKSVDLDGIVREMVGRMQSLALRRNHQLTLQSHLTEPICGNETALREAVRNLIDNAIKHTPEGTEIRITLKNGASVIVEDSGPGLGALTAEEAQMAFRKGATNTDGAGLGLAIVRQAAELHGGKLDIGQSPLGGARFIISLPQQAHEEESA